MFRLQMMNQLVVFVRISILTWYQRLSISKQNDCQVETINHRMTIHPIDLYNGAMEQLVLPIYLFELIKFVEYFRKEVLWTSTF